MKICDCNIKLKQFLQLPMGIVGKIAIWPPAMPGEGLSHLSERVEYFDSVYDEGVKKYEDCKIMQIFASMSIKNMSGELNIVLSSL